MISKMSTTGMNHDEWEKMRQSLKTIGGSDAASILGLNEYNSAYSLWCVKTGKIIPEDISSKEAVRLGNDLEQYVADRFMEATGKKVRRDNNVIYNSDYPFAHANVDRLVIRENAGLECKTTSSWEIAAQLKAGEIPKQWYVQMTHYLMMLGAKKWYLAALVFGQGFYWLELDRNEAEIAALAAAEKEFYELVERQVPPNFDGTAATTEAIKTIYKDAIPGSKIDLSPVSANIEMYCSLQKQIKALQQMQDEAANVIKGYMGDAEGGTFGNYSVSWKASSRKTFDKDKYEKYNGKLPDEYFKVSETRTFRLNEKKG